MKRFILFGILFTFLSAVAHAETRYISDLLKITVRTGPGINHRIIRMIKSGSKVELIEEGEEWSLIKLQDEQEGGWVLSRFLTSKEPAFLVLKRLEKERRALAEKLPLVIEENKKLKEENKKLKLTINDNGATISKLKKSYEDLKEDSAGFLELKKNYKETASKLAEQNKKVEILEKELVRKYIIAGLCGAGILLLGFIIGFSTKRQRRRPLLL